MGIKISNNATGRLSGNITAIATSITLQPGDGARFPALDEGDWFPATIVKVTGEYEIVKVTDRTIDTLTIERGQEATAALAFSAGDHVDLRMTAEVFNTLKQEMFDELLEEGIQLSSLLPPGTGPIPWSRPTEPAGWIFADGRILDGATAYTALRSAYIADGFPFGQDGAGNPRIPDMRGRTAAGIDDLGGTAAGRLTTLVGLGAAGGTETHTLTSGEMPSHGHTATAASAGSHSHSGTSDTEAAHSHTATTAIGGSHSHTLTTANFMPAGEGGTGWQMPGGSGSSVSTSTHSGHTHTVTVNSGGAHSHTVSTDTAAAHSHSITVSNAGSGTAHNNLQPTIALPWILKV